MNKNILRLSGLIGMAAMGMVACQKKTTNPYYGNGTAPTIKVSTTSLAPAPADSMNKVLAISWTNPHYATDSASELYTIQIDSSGRNFSKAVSVQVSGALYDSLTAKQINSLALSLGFQYNVAYNIDIRVISSYSNNNQQLTSNTITINYTPYVTPPKVAPPASKALFLVGSATSGGWNNPVPVPAQAFTELDSVVYSGTFFLNGGQQYLILPVDGDWTNKYAVASANVPATGGPFGYNGGDNTYNTNFPGPATTGLYTITVDFQQGTFTCTSVRQFGLLYVPGDYQGWSPGTAPALGSPAKDGNYDGYVTIPSGGTYQFKFTGEPDWNGATYGDTAGNGQSGVLSLGGGNNLQVPGGGYYEITANTNANTWSATAITSWSIIGSFAASNWSTDIPMTYNSGSNSWSGTITTAANDQFKFRANHAWTINLGDAGGTPGTGGNGVGSLSYNGNNIGDPSKNFSVAPGTHTITIYLGNPGYYSYMIQ
ncbi:MAG TPA: SusE domain-containing protein [Puia sp.]|nr:SusE domain-containing protein [Puia sp.]